MEKDFGMTVVFQRIELERDIGFPDTECTLLTWPSFLAVKKLGTTKGL